jgi:hypothetical protein
MENFSRSFAPEWVSKDLGLNIDNFERSLSVLELNMNDGLQGWVFDKCKKDFEILARIVTKEPERAMR